MQPISVKNLYKSEIGTNETVKVVDDKPELDLPESIVPNAFSGKLKLIRLEDSIMAQGDFEASVNLICDRCLDNFDNNVSFSLEREYFLDRKELNPENEYVDKNLNIDVGPAIREELLLAIPFQNLCSKDCKGICPHCGVNLNHEECKCKM